MTDWVNIDGAPEQEGWYAIHYSWDAEEGSFVDTNYFNGGEWVESYPIIQFAWPFSTKEDAADWADKHDYITW